VSKKHNWVDRWQSNWWKWNWKVKATFSMLGIRYDNKKLRLHATYKLKDGPINWFVFPWHTLSKSGISCHLNCYIQIFKKKKKIVTYKTFIKLSHACVHLKWSCKVIIYTRTRTRKNRVSVEWRFDQSTPSYLPNGPDDPWSFHKCHYQLG